MNNRIFALAILLLTFASCKNEDKKKSDADKAGKSNISMVDQRLTDPYFYKNLQGTIADKPVVFNMVKAGDRIDANYYYVEQGQTIFLIRNWEKTDEDSIYLIEVTNPTAGKSAQLSMAVTNDSLRGVWTSSDGKASYPILLKPVPDNESLQLIAVGLIDSANYTKFKKDTPTLKTAVTVVAAAGENENAKWLNNRIKSIIDNGSKRLNELSLQQTVAALVKNDVDGYVAEVDSSLVGVDDDDPHYFLNREYETMGNVLYHQNGYLVLSMFNYAYTGGAHGNYKTSMYCYDVKGHKQLSLKDIVNADSVILQQLLEQNYRKQYNVPPSTPLDKRLFVNTHKPNDNFYISPRGLGFLYAPYEIASYADGEINVWVPFSELKPYLNPEFARRMAL